MGFAPLPERRAARAWSGAADERSAEEGPRAGRADHPRPEQLHGALQGPSRPQAGPIGAASGQPAADISQWCRVIPSEEKGKYPIDQTDGGEDDDLAEHKRVGTRSWRRWAEIPSRPGSADRRCSIDRRRGRHQRQRRRDLEPAGGARHQERRLAGRAHEHVRAGPAVRPAADGARTARTSC